MKKRIILLITCVLILAQLVTVIAAVGSFRSTYQADMFASLEGGIRAIELVLDSEKQDNYQEIAEKYQQAYGQNIRINFLDEAGNMVADTMLDPSKEPNHADRPEILQAQQGGFGRDVRVSASTGIKTMYVARQLSNGMFLRMAMPLANTQAFVMQAMPVIVLTFVVLTVIALVFSGLIAKGVLTPMNQLYASIKDYMDGESVSFGMDSKYEELADISRAFSDIAQRLNRYIARAKLENKKSALILDNIQEGLLVLDKDQDVLLINPAARRILGASEEITNVNILHFTRRQEILNQIDRAFTKRRNTSFDIYDEALGSTYRFHLSFVSQEAFKLGGEGLLILISDVTDVVMAENVRRDFVANVSHELKTPLTSINGYAQLIENGMVQDSGEVRQYAHKITNEADRLMGLINDTLTLSELEQIAMDEKLEQVDMAAIAEQTQNMLAQKLQEDGVTMHVSGMAKVLANKNRMKQLMLNLCENAIKYNREGGTVDVVLSQDEEFSFIEVKDSGIGIPPSEQNRIFERFYRAKNAGGATKPGTGLGLAIAKHIVQLYGGKIEMESKLGEGSSFVVRLKKILPPNPK